MIRHLFTQHIIPLIRDLVEEYIEANPEADAEQLFAFLGWLSQKAKE